MWKHANIWDKMAEINYANYNSLWRPNPTIKYIGVNKNIKFSPTLCKYFAVSEFDISSGIYEQYFYKH